MASRLDLPPLSASSRTMLADEIYASLRGLIIDGSIPPDARVNGGEIAQQFGVSPTPVREALARLESDGLVEKLPLKGYRTTNLLNAEETAELFELRLLLEPGTARAAAERRDEHDIAALRAEIQRAQSAIDATDAYRLLSQHDVRFHDLVFAAARNETARRAYERTHCHLHTFRLAYTGAYVQGTIDEHVAVAEAIAAGDGDQAEAALRQHIETSRHRLMGAFESV